MKINRQQILEKYDNRCAYCGKFISLKTMQVDHIIPAVFKGTNDITNLNPSCRSCNHYKRSGSLEDFRWLMKTLKDRILKNYINKVAIDYGIIRVRNWDGLFYFEKENQ